MRKKIEIDFGDSSLSVKDLPRNIELKSPDFDYSSNYSDSDPSRLVFNEVFSSKQRLLNPDQYRTAVELFGKFSAAKAEPVTLVGK